MTSKRPATARPLLVVAGILMEMSTSPVFATTDACWYRSDTLKLERTVVVPKEVAQKFIDYLRNEITEDLYPSEVESDQVLDLIFQNIDAGLLAITIEHLKLEHTFSVEVEACDFKRDWQPYWRYVEGKIKAFGRSVEIK